MAKKKTEKSQEESRKETKQTQYAIIFNDKFLSSIEGGGVKKWSDKKSDAIIFKSEESAQEVIGNNKSFSFKKI